MIEVLERQMTTHKLRSGRGRLEMSRRLMVINVDGLTDLTQLPAVVKGNEVIIPPRPEFLSEEGLVKLKSLASNLGGEVIWWKVRARFEELEVASCVKEDCYNPVEGILYCSTHSQTGNRVSMLRPAN